MWLRVIAVTAVITAAFAWAAIRAFPDLEFNWIGAFLSSVGCLAVGFCFLCAFLWLIPPYIRVNRNGISRQQGQSALWRLREEIRRVVVDATDSAHPVVRVESTKKPFVAGLSAKIAPSELARFFRETFPELVVEELR
jgi:hypothetical protein